MSYFTFKQLRELIKEKLPDIKEEDIVFGGNDAMYIANILENPASLQIIHYPGNKIRISTKVGIFYNYKIMEAYCSYFLEDNCLLQVAEISEDFSELWIEKVKL